MAPTTTAASAPSDLDALALRIATVTGVDPAAARRRLHDECIDMGGSVRRELAARGIRPHAWSEELVAFYESTDAFFYELVVWNRSAEKNRQRRWILRFFRRHAPAATSVLCYGDGLGFDGAFLRQAGYRVTCFEVSPRYRAFAERVFAEAGVEVEWIDDERDLAGRTFDVVVCLDVLEHVPDPPALVARLAGMLAAAGLLVVHAPFWLIDAATQTHLAANRTYAGDSRRLYAPSGPEPIDACWMWNPIVLGRPAAAVQGIGPAARFRVVAGSWCLTIARLLPQPFTVAWRWMFRRDARRIMAREARNGPRPIVDT